MPSSERPHPLEPVFIDKAPEFTPTPPTHPRNKSLREMLKLHPDEPVDEALLREDDPGEHLDR